MGEVFEKLANIQERNESVLCVGLDSDISRIPQRFLSDAYPQYAFNRWIIEATHEKVCAFKPNLAFYEAMGSEGIKSLEMTMRYLRNEYPDMVTIADAKRGDIGNTAKAYAQSVFDELGFDMVTVHPYLGGESLEPFLSYEDKGVIVVVKTSNPGGGELQDIELAVSGTVPDGYGTLRLWEHVLMKVADDWNEMGNMAAVIGATYPEELSKAREIAPELPLLVPGVGAQGGSMSDVVERAFVGWGALIVNSSRGVIFADDPLQALDELYSQQLFDTK